MKQILFFLLGLSLVISCRQKDNRESVKPEKSDITPNEIIRNDSVRLAELKNEYMVLGTLFQQKAGEYKALCYQAFNLGKFMLDKDLADKTIDKHRAIILDVDETVLDNSPFQAKCILEGTNYPVNWDEWCQLADAKPLPGAVDFLNYAKANGLSIFYITNRKSHLKEVTVKNLKTAGFPDVDEEHVIMRTTIDSKEPRRSDLMKRNHISLLFGDNLNDFSDIFEGKKPEDRNAEVDNMRRMFGQRFIVLPNTMYGDWELALYDFNQKQPDSVKYRLRRQALIAF